MKDEISIAIADDHGFVRQALITLLKRKVGIKILFEASTGYELLEKLLEAKPDIIILDLEMPVMRGKEAFEHIKKYYPDIKVIIFSAFYDEATILDAVKIGVHSFLPKGHKIDKIIEAIYAVHKQGTFFNEEVSAILAKQIQKVEEPQETLLTKTEVAIIKLICQHKASKEIADELKLAKKTIDWYRDRMFKKTNSRNVTELLEYAIRNKIVKI